MQFQMALGLKKQDTSEGSLSGNSPFRKKLTYGSRQGSGDRNVPRMSSWEMKQRMSFKRKIVSGMGLDLQNLHGHNMIDEERDDDEESSSSQALSSSTSPILKLSSHKQSS